MKETKAMTLRLPVDQAKEIEAVAEIDKVSVSDAVRDAIETHIEARRKDKSFQERLRASLDEHRDILERLSK
jgi:hypothetical protein